MTTNGNGKAPVLVVLQMTGGNDFMNTLVPITEGIYYDSRHTVRIEEDQVIIVVAQTGAAAGTIRIRGAAGTLL